MCCDIPLPPTCRPKGFGKSSGTTGIEPNEGDSKMGSRTCWLKLGLGALAFCISVAGAASAADTIKGQVLGGGAPIAKSTVTLWEAGAAAPKQLDQAKTNDDGRFEVRAKGSSRDGVLYLVASGGVAKAGKATGDNSAIALLAVVGSDPPASVVINEMTTVASVWTGAQFLDGTALKGHALGLKIAAGNVPNFVDPSTGGWGGTIQDSLNSSQTPTMANFATLADGLSGCVTQVSADACSSLFAAATGPALKRCNLARPFLRIFGTGRTVQRKRGVLDIFREECIQSSDVLRQFGDFPS